MTTEYGIIGKKLTHSFSPQFFAAKFHREVIDAVYATFPLDTIEQFPLLLDQRPNIKGLNVTIPYKKDVIAYLDELDNDAEQVGAVNCVLIENGKKKGYNTDIIGFEKSLLPALKSHHNAALVLGTGGAADAVLYVLKKLNIPYQLVSRNKTVETITYEELTEEVISKHKLIINTTPLGMYPNIDSFPPLPYTALSNQHLLYDLVYNPEETHFLSFGKQQGATTINGLQMLEIQAEASWRIWNHLPTV